MLAALLLLHAASGAAKKSSTKKRVHVAAPRKAHGNWAPGYRSGGDERQPLRDAKDTWAASDAAFVPPAGWEVQGFRYSAPDAYVGAYAARRDACAWSPPEDVFRHTRRYLANGYGGAFAGPRWKSKNMYNQWSQYLLNASVCSWRRDDAASGDVFETYVTRLGPITLSPSKIINDFFVPAGPPPGNDTWYLVEAVDGYVDERGGPLTYPPVHPHHSATFLVGFPEALGYETPGSPFFGFNPVAFLPERALAGRDEYIQTSTNTPGFNGDFYGCRGDLDDKATACYYVKLPARRGFPRYPGVDFWSNSVLEHVPPGGPVRLYYEYGRTWVRPREPYAPLFQLDFAVGGDGALYDVTGESVAWFSYVLPVGGRFETSWFHSHGVAPSDFWVLDAPADAVLPADVLNACGDACSSRNAIGRRHARWASNNSGTVGRDVPLAPLGWNTSALMASLLARHRSRVRCWYRSRNAYSASADRFYGRAQLRRKNFTACDDWRFEAGDVVALVAFNRPVTAQTLNAAPRSVRKRGVFPQHHRWWPTAELDFDFGAAWDRAR